jgi:hypothetical protein
MTQANWQEHFKEQLQGLRESFELSGTALSFLNYALQEKKIAAEEYLKWAQKSYQLPCLHSRFFLETPLSQEMFARWATHYRWSVECLPVAEWDGSLIVACLEPPQDFPDVPTFSFVIAEPEALQNAWQQLHPSQEATPPPAEVPDGLSMAAVQSPSEKKEDHRDLLNFETHVAPPTLVKLDIPEFKEGDQSQDDPLVAPPKQIANDALEHSVVAGKSENSKIIKTVVPASPHPPLNPSYQADENRNIPASPTSATALKGKPQSHPAPSTAFALEKIKKQQGSLMAEKVKKALGDMKTHFKKAMILTLDENESQIMVFAWDESFQGIPDTSVRIPLKSPSIFNIVASTQKPFHGYVSLNQLNEKFFEDWNHGSIPDHVTITPVISNDKVIAMLMGFADKSAYNKSSLQWAEKLSAEFIKDLAA